MKRRPLASMLSVLALLSACSGGSGGSSGSIVAATPTPSPTPTPTPTPTATCSLLDRQNWAFSTLQEWYLFPNLLPSNLNPAPYNTVSDYIDA
ncbi:MAG: S41 family peptidase, partial [Sphingomonas sp.]